MIIDWTAAPEGATHGMAVGGGEVRWYRVGVHVECWSVTIGWTQSFFLTKEEFKDAGLHLYEHGEQSELVMLREQREALLEALKDLKRELVLSDVDLDYMETHFRPWLNKAEQAIERVERS